LHIKPDLSLYSCYFSIISALKIQSVERKLQVKNLSKIYTRTDASTQVVLNNINIDVKNGEFVTIVEPSGCGKSTLLNILAGLENSYTSEYILMVKQLIL
jgi:sulfonate transport system ATP-binding protein